MVRLVRQWQTSRTVHRYSVVADVVSDDTLWSDLYEPDPHPPECANDWLPLASILDMQRIHRNDDSKYYRPQPTEHGEWMDGMLSWRGNSGLLLHDLQAHTPTEIRRFQSKCRRMYLTDSWTPRQCPSRCHQIAWASHIAINQKLPLRSSALRMHKTVGLWIQELKLNECPRNRSANRCRNGSAWIQWYAHRRSNHNYIPLHDVIRCRVEHAPTCSALGPQNVPCNIARSVSECTWECALC